jgi:hypothetical protein
MMQGSNTSVDEEMRLYEVMREMMAYRAIYSADLL